MVVALDGEEAEDWQEQADREAFCNAPTAEILVSPRDNDGALPLEEGDTLEIEPGVAGGAFAWLGFESEGLSQVVWFDVSVTFDFGRAEPTVAGWEFRRLTERPDPEVTRQRSSVASLAMPCELFPPPTNCPLEQLPSHDAVVEMTLTDLAGRSVRVERAVTWEIGPPP